LRPRVIRFFIASVWVINGLFCKVLNLVPRHERIVARILGPTHAHLFTVLIGVAETAMAIWVMSGIYPRLNARVQIGVVAAMNALEFFLVPDLLLWGRGNAIFALLFILLIYYHAFWLEKSPVSGRSFL
jgi:DoxX-like family